MHAERKLSGFASVGVKAFFPFFSCTSLNLGPWRFAAQRVTKNASRKASKLGRIPCDPVDLLGIDQLANSLKSSLLKKFQVVRNDAAEFEWSLFARTGFGSLVEARQSRHSLNSGILYLKTSLQSLQFESV